MPGEITFSGFNGFDFNQIIDVTIEAESTPLRALQQKESDLKSKDSSVVTFGGEIADLQDTSNPWSKSNPAALRRANGG